MQDERDADATLDVSEHEVVPRLSARDDARRPRGWLLMRMGKVAIKIAGLRVGGGHRMLADHAGQV